MAVKVDARGRSCPEPVILAKKAMAAGEFPIEVRVETVTSRDNVRRLAERSGWTVTVRGEGEEFTLTLTRET